MKRGDQIAVVAQPVAKAVDYLFGTDIQNCFGCKKMQNNLNAGMNLAEAFYDRFWPQQEDKDAVHSNKTDSSGSGNT